MDKRVVACPHCGTSGKVDVSTTKVEKIAIRCPKCQKNFEYSKERRTAPRKAPLPAVAMGPYGLDFDHMDRMGTLMDLSIKGMRVRINSNPPAVGNRFNFKFPLPPSCESIKVGGEVVWVKKTAEEAAYEFGVEFTMVDQYNREAIGFFLMPQELGEVLEMERDVD